MPEKFLKTKIWNNKIVNEFSKELGNAEKAYTNEYKCQIVKEVANELLKRGGNSNISSAENILIHSTQHYFENIASQTKAGIYYCLGLLYEKYKENFIRAYTYYEKYTLNNSECSGNHSLMLKALILRDDFTYSEELEKEFRMSLSEADLGRKNDRIYENIGRYIILNKEGNTEECKKVIKRLWGIVKTDELILPDLIIKKNLNDRVTVPQKVVEFIKAKNTELNATSNKY